MTDAKQVKLEDYQKDAFKRKKFLTELINHAPVGLLANTTSEDIFGHTYYCSEGVFSEIDRLKDQCRPSILQRR